MSIPVDSKSETSFLSSFSSKALKKPKIALSSSSRNFPGRSKVNVPNSLKSGNSESAKSNSTPVAEKGKGDQEKESKNGGVSTISENPKIGDENSSWLTASVLTLTVGGREITIETGRIGRQANGAVMIRDGDTMVYATACAEEEAGDTDFLPLSVNYQERFSAAGRTSGGFFKKEGKIRDHEVLVSRLIDRPIRPMVAKGFSRETQLLLWVMSYDGEHSADALSITAAGAALAISDIPLLKPVAGVRVGLIDGKYVVNPTVQQMKNSTLDMVVAGTSDAVLMIEGYCDLLSEEQLLEAVQVGQDALSEICKELAKWREEVGKPKIDASSYMPPKELKGLMKELAGKDTTRALMVKGKKERSVAVHALEQRLMEALTGKAGTFKPDTQTPLEEVVSSKDERVIDDDDAPLLALLEVEEDDSSEKQPISTKPVTSTQLYSPGDVKQAFKSVMSEEMRRLVVEEGLRSDGRGPRDIRPITSSCGLLPRVHGSVLFTRGETQAIAVATLGGENMGQRLDNMTCQELKRFYLQYTFPPSSVGETGRIFGSSRREIGHGTLAERALEPVLPDVVDFPYTVRVESTITESNGSSSMASVCGGCLAMLDAGVPLKSSVAGVAMGLILNTEEGGGREREPMILSDILGSEDALGDMDFKVAGNEVGVTAFQMDIKVEGITVEVMAKALQQAKEGRCHILGEMAKCSPSPANQLSTYAPRIVSLKIAAEKVKEIVGSQGKTIRSIMEQSGVDNIDVKDDGSITILAKDLESMQIARRRIDAICMVPEVGKTYRNCAVKSLMPYGVFVEIAPGKEGLCHISELSLNRLNQVQDAVKEGDFIDVKLLEINTRGQLRLSRKAVLLAEMQQTPVEVSAGEG